MLLLASVLDTESIKFGGILVPGHAELLELLDLIR